MRETLNLQRSLRYLLACAPTIALVRPIFAQRPVSDAVLQTATLSFLGHATVGDFVGTTTTVRGAIIGGRDYATTRGWVEAPVRTLATGNDRRDRDLRSSMNVDRYPAIRFDLSGATVLSSSQGTLDSLALVLHGALTIHGVKRSVDLPATGVRARAQRTSAVAFHWTSPTTTSAASRRCSGYCAWSA
ncbi:MAG TPA: YceI family protein [Gemmatimonadaceae bacterium]|nr:YceI family protein [Gemmatimonadaceae bacterium]